MSDDKRIEVHLNPLNFIEVDEPWASIGTREITLETILSFICTPGIGSERDILISRYKEISIEKPRLFAAPNEQRILDKLIWPLRHAKAAYMVGNYLGTIALCGMVAEMVAILLFEISNFRLNNKPMSEQDQSGVFGSEFEKLGQDRRVKILNAYGIINDQLKKAFDMIRTKRKRYLHIWSQDHDRLPADAIEAFNAAVLIVVSAIGQDLQEGRLMLNPKLIQYLDQKGIKHEENETRV